MRPELNDDMDADDPILSLVNLIDVFLVIIAALLLSVSGMPMNSFSQDKLTIIRNAGQADMEVLIKDGNKIEHFKSTGGRGAGQGTKAGSAYRMPDGSLVFVPE